MSSSSSMVTSYVIVSSMRRYGPHFTGGDISPEVVQAFVRAEQSAEDRRVREEHVARAVTSRRHPEEHVELGVSRLGEWMRISHVYWLSRQHMNSRRVVGDRVMRQVHVKVKSCDSLKPLPGIQISHD